VNGDKAKLRNCLIQEGKAEENRAPENATWLIDGMATINTVQPKKNVG